MPHRYREKAVQHTESARDHGILILNFERPDYRMQLQGFIRFLCLDMLVLLTWLWVWSAEILESDNIANRVGYY